MSKYSTKSFGYVYFILAESERLIKIGYSSRYPDGRLTHIRVGSPCTLLRFGYIWGGDRALEKELHVRYRHLRSHGEWFRAEYDLLAYIRKYAYPWEIRTHSGSADREARIEMQFRKDMNTYDPQRQFHVLIRNLIEQSSAFKLGSKKD